MVLCYYNCAVVVAAAVTAAAAVAAASAAASAATAALLRSPLPLIFSFYRHAQNLKIARLWI